MKWNVLSSRSPHCWQIGQSSRGMTNLAAGGDALIRRERLAGIRSRDAL
jgi:hypothetical protein